MRLGIEGYSTLIAVVRPYVLDVYHVSNCK